MINPYMPDMKKIEYAYHHITQKAPELETKQSISITHPYKTLEDAVNALRNQESDPHVVLAKTSQALRRDSKAMLELIREVPEAYIYANDSMKTTEFKENALRNNPAVYDLLSDSDRKMDRISIAYRQSMFDRAYLAPLDSSTKSMQLKCQFSQHTNKEQVLDEQTFERSFEALVSRDPYGDKGELNKDFLTVSTTLMLRPEIAQRLEQIQHDVWQRQEKRVAELAHNDRSLMHVDQTLTAIETQCPEMKHLIDERQRQYWESRQEELQKMLNRQERGETLNGVEQRIIQEAEKHITISREDTKKTQERIDEEQRQTNAYVVRSAQDKVLTAAAMGEITEAQASDIVANIGNAPTTSTKSESIEVQAKAIDLANDTDNVNVAMEEAGREETTEHAVVDVLFDGRDGLAPNRENADPIELFDEEFSDQILGDMIVTQDQDPDELYENEYAGNPFVSFVSPEPLEPEYKIT